MAPAPAGSTGVVLIYQNDVINAERISATETSKSSALMERLDVDGECDESTSQPLGYFSGGQPSSEVLQRYCEAAR